MFWIQFMHIDSNGKLQQNCSEYSLCTLTVLVNFNKTVLNTVYAHWQYWKTSIKMFWIQFMHIDSNGKLQQNCSEYSLCTLTVLVNFNKTVLNTVYAHWQYW